MTIAYIDVAKAPVQVPVIDLLQEPQGAAFDFISGQAWIVDKVNSANTMLRNIGDVLTNPGASPTKLLRRKSGLLESAPWWANEYDVAGNPMGMRTEAQRVRLNKYPVALDNAAWVKSGCVVTPTGQAGYFGSGSFKLAGTVSRSRILQSGSSGSAALWCGWAVVEAGEWQFATIGRGNGAGLWTCLTFDLLTGQMVNRADASTQPTLLEWGSISLGNGRWLIWMRTNEVGGTFYLGPSYTASGYLFQGATFPYDGVAGIVVHGIEVEDGPFPTSPILAAETAAATRAADQPQIPTGFLPFSADEGTLILDGMAYDYDGVSASALNFTGSGTRYVRLDKNDTGSRNACFDVSFRNSSLDGLSLPNLSFPVTPNPKKVGASWGALGEAIASGASGSSAEKAVPTMTFPAPFTSLVFGPAGGIMWYRSAIYIPRKLTAAELLARVRP